MTSVVGFRSYVLARMDTDKGGLVLSVAPHGPGPTTKFQQAIDVLGFDPTGAVFPMWAEEKKLYFVSDRSHAANIFC